MVDQGDRITLHLVSNDVGHGFALPAFDVKVEEPLDHRYTRVVTFVADETGRFTFRCYLNCGNLHPYMVGELVVRPNQVLRAGLLGVPIAALLGAAWALGEPAKRTARGGRGRDLLARRPWLRRLFVARWPQFAVQAMLLAGFAFAIFAGLVGLQNGAHNLAVVAVWLGWWFVLVAIAVPLTGRAWCGVCPLPLPGEWLARRRFLGPPGAPPADRRPPWPWRRYGLAPAYGLLLAMAAVAMLLTTSPRVTALALAALLVVAALVTFRYRGRAFCHHLCPIAPFLRLYGRLAPLTLRAHDTHRCGDHRTKQCLRGADGAWRCPWESYPAAPDAAGCGFCLECVRSCSHANVGLRLRSPRPLLERVRLRSDEIFGAALLVGLALTYQLTMLGPFPGLKDGAAMDSGVLAYLRYLGLLAGLVLLVPALLWGAARLAAPRGLDLRATVMAAGGLLLVNGWLAPPPLRFVAAATGIATLAAATRLPRHTAAPAQTRELRRAAAVGLLPLGLLAWIAFKLPVILVNWVYLPRVASDPLGWGWNLFGTAHLAGGPLLAGWVASLQVALVLLGLAWGARLITGRLRHGRAGTTLATAATPLLGLLGGIAIVFIRMFGG